MGSQARSPPEDLPVARASVFMEASGIVTAIVGSESSLMSGVFCLCLLFKDRLSEVLKQQGPLRQSSD